jgi:hypothetical protein
LTDEEIDGIDDISQTLLQTNISEFISLKMSLQEMIAFFESLSSGFNFGLAERERAIEVR